MAAECGKSPVRLWRRRGLRHHVANLKRSGHDVITVSDAGHALTAALESGPEIVLLHGPRDEIDRDLSRRLRGIPQLSRSAIVYIGTDTGVEATAWFGAGVDLVLASLPEDAALFRLLEEARARVRLLQRNEVGSYSPRPAASAESRPAADSPSTPAADERQTILVVDDERTIRRLVEGVLRRVGYTVVAKDSPGSALEWWHEHGDEVALVIHRHRHARRNRARDAGHDAGHTARSRGHHHVRRRG